MGAGFHGGFGGTEGVAFGSTNYMKPTDNFGKFIKKRTDIEANGFYDIIAHGNEYTIEVQQNGRSILVNHRTAATY